MVSSGVKWPLGPGGTLAPLICTTRVLFTSPAGAGLHSLLADDLHLLEDFASTSSEWAHEHEKRKHSRTVGARLCRRHYAVLGVKDERMIFGENENRCINENRSWKPNTKAGFVDAEYTNF